MPARSRRSRWPRATRSRAARRSCGSCSSGSPTYSTSSAIRTAHTSSASSTRVWGRSTSMPWRSFRPRQALVEPLAGDAQAAGGGRLRPARGDERLEHGLGRVVEAGLDPLACEHRSGPPPAERPEAVGRTHRRPGGGRDQAGALGAGEGVAELARLAAARSRPDGGDGAAADEVAGDGRHVDVAAHGDDRPVPVDERVHPHPLEPLERPAAVDRPERRPGQVDADRPRPADDVGGVAGPALGQALQQPGALGRRHLVRRRLGGEGDAEQERGLVQGERVELVAVAREHVQPAAGVHRAATGAPSAGAGAGGRARRGRRRRGRPRARSRSGVRSMRSNSTCAPSTPPSAATRPLGPEALAGRIAQLGLQCHRPAQRLRARRRRAARGRRG